MTTLEAGGRWGWVPGRDHLKRISRMARLRLYADPVRRLYESGRLAAERLTLPRFLGIGAPKSGTTWLHHNMAVHPGLYLPKRKELHYFSGHQYRGLHWYAKQFGEAGDRIPGEITPGYATLPMNDIKRIHSLLPDVRLLLLVRNPIDRAWSHAVMKLARERSRDVTDVPDGEYLEHFRSRHSIDRGDYSRMIDQWRSVFRGDQLWIGSFDDIKEDPTRLLESAFVHVGTGTDVNWEAFPYAQVIDRGVHGTADVIGKSTRPDVPERFLEPLTEIYEPKIELLALEYPKLAKRWLP